LIAVTGLLLGLSPKIAQAESLRPKIVLAAFGNNVGVPKDVAIANSQCDNKMTLTGHNFGFVSFSSIGFVSPLLACGESFPRWADIGNEIHFFRWEPASAAGLKTGGQIFRRSLSIVLDSPSYFVKKIVGLGRSWEKFHFRRINNQQGGLDSLKAFIGILRGLGSSVRSIGGLLIGAPDQNCKEKIPSNDERTDHLNAKLYRLAAIFLGLIGFLLIAKGWWNAHYGNRAVWEGLAIWGVGFLITGGAVLIFGFHCC
jgi:hypothetical protein